MKLRVARGAHEDAPSPGFAAFEEARRALCGWRHTVTAFAACVEASRARCANRALARVPGTGMGIASVKPAHIRGHFHAAFRASTWPGQSANHEPKLRHSRRLSRGVSLARTGSTPSGKGVRRSVSTAAWRGFGAP